MSKKCKHRGEVRVTRYDKLTHIPTKSRCLDCQEILTNPDIKKLRDIIRKASKKKIKWEVFFDKSHKYI